MADRLGDKRKRRKKTKSFVALLGDKSLPANRSKELTVMQKITIFVLSRDEKSPNFAPNQTKQKQLSLYYSRFKHPLIT